MYSVVLMAAITVGGEVPDFGHRGGRGCCGCYGGGYAGCYGGYGGCYGCYGGYARYGCYGGGWGGCYGGWGGYGGYVSYGCGGYAGYGCGGYAGYGCGGYVSSSPYLPTATYYAQGTVVSGSVATLVVNVPADATLTVDGAPTQAKEGRRVFTTPPLEQGKTYYYTLRAQAVRDGQTVETSQQAVVRPGQETTISLDFAPAAVASRE